MEELYLSNASRYMFLTENENTPETPQSLHLSLVHPSADSSTDWFLRANTCTGIHRLYLSVRLSAGTVFVGGECNDPNTLPRTESGLCLRPGVALFLGFSVLQRVQLR